MNEAMWTKWRENLSFCPSDAARASQGGSSSSSSNMDVKPFVSPQIFRPDHKIWHSQFVSILLIAHRWSRRTVEQTHSIRVRQSNKQYLDATVATAPSNRMPTLNYFETILQNVFAVRVTVGAIPAHPHIIRMHCVRWVDWSKIPSTNEFYPNTKHTHWHALASLRPWRTMRHSQDVFLRNLRRRT